MVSAARLYEPSLDTGHNLVLTGWCLSQGCLWRGSLQTSGLSTLSPETHWQRRLALEEEYNPGRGAVYLVRKQLLTIPDVSIAIKHSRRSRICDATRRQITVIAVCVTVTCSRTSGNVRVGLRLMLWPLAYMQNQHSKHRHKSSSSGRGKGCRGARPAGCTDWRVGRLICTLHHLKFNV